MFIFQLWMLVTVTICEIKLVDYFLFRLYYDAFTLFWIELAKRHIIMLAQEFSKKA